MNDKQPIPATDDTDGSSMRWSDAEIKHDVEPVTAPEPTDDDTEGSGWRHP
jgi:hypothetical protein